MCFPDEGWRNSRNVESPNNNADKEIMVTYNYSVALIVFLVLFFILHSNFKIALVHTEHTQ